MCGPTLDSFETRIIAILSFWSVSELTNRSAREVRAVMNGLMVDLPIYELTGKGLAIVEVLRIDAAR